MSEALRIAAGLFRSDKTDELLRMTRGRKDRAARDGEPVRHG